METLVAQDQVAPDDPLYHFLAECVLRQLLGVEVAEPHFEIRDTQKEGVIVHFHERNSGIDLVGKFFARRGVDDSGSIDADRAAELMQQEFDRLTTVWNLGLNQPPHRVVRPLAVNRELDALLVEEYIAGKPLDDYLKAGLGGTDTTELAQRLTQVAHFLAALHQRSQQDEPVEAAAGLDYLQKVIEQLAQDDLFQESEKERLLQLCQRWQQSGRLNAPQRVLVHGDVTPVNIVFTDGELIAIDLERLHPADPALDLGSALAEIIHAAQLQGRTLDDTVALRRIFLDSYRLHRNLTAAEYHALEPRIHFFTGTMFLRIARNHWLDQPYRRSLLPLAERMLTQ